MQASGSEVKPFFGYGRCSGLRDHASDVFEARDVAACGWYWAHAAPQDLFSGWFALSPLDSPPDLGGVQRFRKFVLVRSAAEPVQTEPEEPVAEGRSRKRGWTGNGD